ncbi:MAG: glycosyltransferase family 4 protein [Armatimonadota bacterium]|nr:glycosyltransferase family 4 protein [bacterium]MDW8322179.1 glycosyltransferase family 4 protein [Armatimonadota bacterium]
MIKLVHIATSPLFLNFFRGQVAYMQARGLHVSVITSPGELLQQFAQREQVDAYPVAMHRRITPVQDMLALARICRILHRVRPHIVHAHTPKGGLLGTVAAWLCRVPVRIYHIRGLPHLAASGMKRRLLRRSEKVACRLAHQVLCVSQSIRQVAVEDGLCSAEKVKVLGAGSGQGVDAEGRFNPSRFLEQQKRLLRHQLGIPENGLVIGYVGRIVRDKGIVELTEAWRRLRDDYPQAHLLLVGEYEEQDPVPMEVRRLLESDPRVHITGWLSDVALYYAIMHLLVLPSYREGFPNTPLEAAAMELPVVVTDIPGCRDAVEDGQTALMVPPADAAALQHAIRRYLEEPELRQRHGKAGRERVLKHFRQELLWQALYEEYVSLLGKRNISLDGE